MQALDFRRATMSKVIIICSSVAGTVTTTGAWRDFQAAADLPASDGLIWWGLGETFSAIGLFMLAWCARWLVAHYVPPTAHDDHV